MIVDLPSSTVSASTRRWCELRTEGGVQALGRVLTLVIMTDDGNAIEGAIEAANSASREHPCRVIVLAARPAQGRGAARRADPGRRRRGRQSDVIVLRGYGPLAADEPGAGMVMPLLLPDAPVVAWWPSEAPAGAVRGRRRQAGAAAHHRRALGEEPDRRRSSSGAPTTWPATPT